jgi:hypothetical protein
MTVLVRRGVGGTEDTMAVALHDGCSSSLLVAASTHVLLHPKVKRSGKLRILCSF